MNINKKKYLFILFLIGLFSVDLKAEENLSMEFASLLRIHGSNTIGEKFAPELIKGFLQQEKFFIRNSDSLNVKIERHINAQQGVRGQKLDIELFAHGSSTGFRDLLSLQTDIVMSSRKIKAKEIRQISRLYPSIVDKTTEHIIAYDALAIVINSNQDLNSISLSDLAKIFSGELTNWKELGGQDLAIKVLSRDNNSGTYDSFKSLVLKPFDKLLSTDSIRFESSSALASMIEDTDGAIGFIGISHTGNNKILAISSNGQGNGMLPNLYTIGTEDYPLSRKLYLYLPLEIENTIAHKFVSYVESNAGQSLAEKSQLISYFPTKSRPLLKNEGIKSKYKNLATFGQRLSITFRLVDEHLDARATRDIERLIQYSKHNPLKKVVLVGFWDDGETTNPNLLVVNQWMRLLKDELQTQTIEPWLVDGGYFPIENSHTVSGMMINRRIEVWTL